MTEKFNVVGEGGDAVGPAPAPPPGPAPAPAVEKPSGPVTQTHDDGSKTVFENRDGEYVYQDFDADGNPVGPPRRGGTGPSGLGEGDPGPKVGDGGAQPAPSTPVEENAPATGGPAVESGEAAEPAPDLLDVMPDPPATTPIPSAPEPQAEVDVAADPANEFAVPEPEAEPEPAPPLDGGRDDDGDGDGDGDGEEEYDESGKGMTMKDIPNASLRAAPVDQTLGDLPPEPFPL